jgi:hypothetical protein
MLEKDESPKGFDLPLEIQLESISSQKSISIPNVAAILEGSDPSLKNEYVVNSAHSTISDLQERLKKTKLTMVLWIMHRVL